MGDDLEMVELDWFKRILGEGMGMGWGLDKRFFGHARRVEGGLVVVMKARIGKGE